MSSNNAWRKFSAETVQRLLTAVDEDDRVDDSVSLPAVIDLQSSQENIRNNYALCLQYWEEGFTRKILLDLVNKLLKGSSLSPAERGQYKLIRSRYKHLRFAQRLYCQQHLSRLRFSETTVFLGKLQDAFRNDDKKNILFYARVLRLYLSPPIWRIVHYSLRHMPLESAQGFTSYCQQQMCTLKAFISKPELTGKEFHTVRKIVSEMVSYYDTLRTIDPTNQSACQVSRFLAAINGLMGDRHDEMVTDNLAGRNAYNTPTKLDHNIRQRLELLLERYPW